MNKLIVTVRRDDGSSPAEEFTFYGTIHCRGDLNQLALDPINFYLKYNKKLPTIPHHEIRIDLDKCGLTGHPNLHLVHYHHSDRTNLDYVCWTEMMPTAEIAEKTFKIWCLGTAYTLVKGEDFSSVFYKCKSPDDFIALMEKSEKLQISKIWSI